MEKSQIKIIEKKQEKTFQIQEFYKQAKNLDEEDNLKEFRNQFYLNENQNYFCGHSLGLLSKRAKQAIQDNVMNCWAKRGARAHGQTWFTHPLKASKLLAKLFHVLPEEIVIAQSVSINIFKIGFSLLANSKDRSIILTDETNFPCDQYVLQGLVEQHFKDKKLIKFKATEDMVAIDQETIKQALTEDVSFLLLSHVLFKSSYIYDMKKINKWAQEKGVYVIWDLSHSAGAIDFNLKEMGCKIAVGCTYKYLNGGPGSQAFIYIDKELIPKLTNPITSWYAHEKPFDFSTQFKPCEGIWKFTISGSAMVSMSTIVPSLQIMLEAGMSNLRKKSLSLSNFFIKMVDTTLVPFGFEMVSPRQQQRRASHVAISHQHAKYIIKQLLYPKTPGKKVFALDYRPPNKLRIGLTPLYVNHIQLVQFIERLIQILQNQLIEILKSGNNRDDIKLS